MTVFKNFKNVSQQYLQTLKTNQCSMIIFGIMNEYKTVWDTFSRHRALYLKIKEHARVSKSNEHF